jgi:ABC-2 type transport system ATP-binding protein
VLNVTPADRQGSAAGFEIDVEAGRDVRRDLSREVVGSGWGLLELRPLRISLEDIFLELTTDEASKQPGDDVEPVEPVEPPQGDSPNA